MTVDLPIRLNFDIIVVTLELAACIQCLVEVRDEQRIRRDPRRDCTRVPFSLRYSFQTNGIVIRGALQVGSDATTLPFSQTSLQW